jgi:hypothetical protein
MENTRYAHKRDVRLPYTLENNHSKTPMQLFGEEVTNYKQLANPYNKIGFGIQHSQNTGQTKNKTNVYTDGLNIQMRPIGETVNRNFQGIKVVRPPYDDANAYKWTFNNQNSSLKAPFSSYNLPRDHTPSQYVGV